MKKSLYYITALSLLMSVFPGAGYAEAAKAQTFETEVLMTVDFDKNSADVVFSASDSSGEGYSSQIKDSGMSGYGKSLALQRSGSDEYGVFAELELGDAKIKPKDGKYLIEYDVLTSATDQWAPYIILGAGDDNTKLSVIGANTSSVVCSYASNPSTPAWWAIYETNTEAEVNLLASSWMKVKIMIDTVSSTADYYYDGTYVGRQTADMLGAAVNNGFDSLRFELWSHSGFEPEVLIDNLSVSKILPTVSGAYVADASGKRFAAEGTIGAVSKQLEIEVENLTLEKDFLDTVALTDSEGAVTYTPSISDGICTLYLEDYMKNGEAYTLKALGKSYTFTVNYGEKAYVSKVSLKTLLGTDELKNLDTVTAKTALKAEAMLVNPKGEEGTYSIAVACFDGNELISAKTKTLTMDSTKIISDGNLPFAAPAAEKLSIHIFAFSDMSELTPLCSGLVLGEEESEEEGDNAYSVKAEGKAGENAVLTVFFPEKSAEDFPEAAKPTELFGTLAYVNQKTVSADGAVAFTVKLNKDNASGVYKGILSVGSEKLPQRLVFVNKTENESALLAFNGAEDAAATAKANSAALGFGRYSDMVSDKAYQIYADAISGLTIDETDFDSNQKLVKKSELLACVNDGTVENIFEYKDIFGDEFADIREFFDKSYFTEALQKAITAKLAAGKTESLSKLKAALNEAFVLSMIANPNGYENITPVLEAFADDIGIASGKITDAVSSELSGNTYSDYYDLKRAINSAAEDDDRHIGSGSSGGSSSSSGMSVVGATVAEPVKEIPKTIYTDVPAEHWASEAVIYLTEKGVLSGKDNNLYEPNANVTREEFAKMIISAFFEGEEFEAVELPFEDVKKDAWYYQYLQQAYAHRIISGQSESLFGIGESITRQDAAVIMNRTAEVNRYNFSVPDSFIRFEDDAEIAEYASEAVYTLKEAGVMRGDGGYCHPKAYMTRAEAAVLIYSMLSM